MNVGALMIPVAQLRLLRDEASAAAVDYALSESPHGFVLLTGPGGADDLRAVIQAADSSPPARDYRQAAPVPAAHLRSSPCFVSVTLPAEQALAKMGEHLVAIVVDEYGTSLGAVTRSMLSPAKGR